MRSGDARAVADALLLRTVVPSGWRHGLAESATAGVFVTPPIDGFVLAVGKDLGLAALDPAFVAPLGARFGRAAAFVCDEELEVFGWALADGETVRVYAYDGDAGHVLWEGDVTPDERELGCFVDDPRDGSDDTEKWWPDAALVRALAARWSVDPAGLGARGLPPSAGWFGRR